jgi:hypothetical protein
MGTRINRDQSSLNPRHRRGVGQVQTQVFVGVKFPGLTDQPIGKFGIDAPITVSIGISASVERETGSRMPM